MSQKKKKRFGDRFDGERIRDIEGIQFVTGVMYPNRTDNEAYISEAVDLEPIKAYIARKNETEDKNFKYTFFHVIVTALLRTIYHRPKMNRFIANNTFYQRNYLSASFVVKKQFSDSGAEGFAIIKAKPEDTMDSIHEKVRAIVQKERSEKSANSTEDAIDFFAKKVPAFISKFLIRRLMWLEKHGWAPRSLIAADPYYNTVILSNLGSIKLHSGYHHLTNWGTTSIFCIVGEKYLKTVEGEKGPEKHEFLDLGLTIDERLADGYYYSKTIKLLQHLLKHPELLDEPMEKEIEYEF